jgi:hypothetical protein
MLALEQGGGRWVRSVFHIRSKNCISEFTGMYISCVRIMNLGDVILSVKITEFLLI